METATEAVSNSTADAWRERITSQRASGQSIRAWCRQNCLHEHAYYWWRCRLGLAPMRKRRSRQVRELGFAQVLMDPVAAVEPPVADGVKPILLRLAGGRELALPMSMPARLIVALLRELEAAQ